MTKKQRRYKGNANEGRPGALFPPIQEETEENARLVNGLYNIDNGVMMTTSEILDFAEGADST